VVCVPGLDANIQRYVDECSGSDARQPPIELAKIRLPRQRLLNLAVGLWRLKNKCNNTSSSRQRRLILARLFKAGGAVA